MKILLLDPFPTFRTKAFIFPVVRNVAWRQLTAESFSRNCSRLKRAVSLKSKPPSQGNLYPKLGQRKAAKTRPLASGVGSRGLKMQILASKLLMGWLEAFVADILHFNFSLYSVLLISIPYWCLSQGPPLINHLHAHLHHWVCFWDERRAPKYNLKCSWICQWQEWWL